MAQVKLHNVVKRYGPQEVVHGLDLTIKDGEFVVFVGPSGCGKSTLLRMIAGLESISDGTISIGDWVVNDVPPQRRNLAMVFQNYALYPHKSVRENIIFGLRKARLPKAEIAKRLDSAASVLQLESYLDRKPAALSGGQRQRVAMGRAIVRDVDVFLFDEPLSNLDAKLRHEMRTEIRRLHKRYGTTSIYVTHDQVEAMTLADQVVVLRDGRVEQVGRPMDIYLNPANLFTATFIGSPAMNILDGTLQADQLTVGSIRIALTDYARSAAAELLGPGQGARKVRIGIRPEFLTETRLIAGHSEHVLRFQDVGAELVEPLGFNKDVSIRLGGQSALARLDLRSDVPEGGKLDLSVEWTRIHFFDPDTGLNLRCSQPPSTLVESVLWDVAK